jgi:hypothetical protein
MASFKDVLSKLFSRNIVIARAAPNRLKVIDSNHLQSSGNPALKNDRFRWKNTKSYKSNSGYYSYGTTGVDIESQRYKLYGEYDMMDNDSIIASALDIYADCAITEDNFSDEILIISTQDDTIKKVLYNLFYDIMNIEFNMWSWVRNLCKYGDFFLYLDIKEDLGIVNIIPFNPAIIRRVEDMSENNLPVVAFQLDIAASPMLPEKTLYEPYEIAHFRLLTDTNYLPYGKSIIETCRKDFKMLLMMEEAMMLHRIMRAPSKRVFKIDVGSIAPSEVDSYIEEIVSSIKKVPYIDEATGDYNLKFNLQNMMEDFYLPVRGSDSGTSIEPLDGISNEGQIEDIDYFKNKIFSALKIPKAYMGQDENTDGKTLLSAQDMRFSSTIKRIQKIVISELYKIATVHLLAQGFKTSDIMNFELKMPNSSIIFQRQQVDLLNEQLNAIGTILEKRILSKQYIYEHIFKMSPEDWQADQERIIEDLKRSFREEQIATEGNDPKVSGKSFGTPHDLMSMQLAGKISIDGEDKRVENPGRPIEPGTYGTDDDKLMGRDPNGIKAMNRLESRLSKNDIYKLKNLSSKTASKKIVLENNEVANNSKLANLDEDLLLESEL